MWTQVFALGCLFLGGCALRTAPSEPAPAPEPPAPVAPVEIQAPRPSPPAPDWSPRVATVITAADGRCLLAPAGPAFPPGSTLDITDPLGTPVGSALVLEPEGGRPPLLRLIGLSNSTRPVATGDHLRIHQEPPPKPAPPAEEHPAGEELPPPGSLADLERLAKGKELSAIKSAQMARLEAERRWMELAARVLRLPAGGPELGDLQERLRRELADHPELKP